MRRMVKPLRGFGRWRQGQTAFVTDPQVGAVSGLLSP
jgi:hypothetical protein